MSTIPNLSPGFSPVDYHTTIKMEIDGDGEASGSATHHRTMDNTRIEKIFSNHHSSCRTTPVTNGFSSWDSDSEPELVGKIFTSDAPWFNVADRRVMHEKAIDEALSKFEAECDEDTPLKFRPFMETAVRKLRKSLKDRLKFEFLLEDFLLDDEDGPATARRSEFDRWSQEVVFPVKRRRYCCGSRPSDSPEF